MKTDAFAQNTFFEMVDFRINAEVFDATLHYSA